MELPGERHLGIKELQEPPPAAATNSGNREFHGPGSAWNHPGKNSPSHSQGHSRRCQGFAPQIVPCRCSLSTTHSLSCNRAWEFPVGFSGNEGIVPCQCGELKTRIWGFFHPVTQLCSHPVCQRALLSQRPSGKGEENPAG